MRLLALGSIFLFLAGISLSSQETEPDIAKSIREKGLVLKIHSRVVTGDNQEIWQSDSSKVTIPGRAISLKLVGTNVVVVVQFTPYTQVDGSHLLVAQCQVWASSPGKGVRYQTTMQTLPLQLGEKLIFFPLGQKTVSGGSRIEMEIELNPYAIPDSEQK